MKISAFLATIIGVSLVVAYAGASDGNEIRAYDFLEPIDLQPEPFVPERSGFSDEGTPPISLNLLPFYDDFEKDGEVSFYVGYGYQSYYPERVEQIQEMLKRLAAYYGVALTDWRISSDRKTLRFREANRGIRYVVQVDKTRDAYIDAFSKYEVVLYHGHSRYGHGPAFENFQNYFRMGKRFETIEMDAFNPYFRNEEIQGTDKYPLRQVVMGGTVYPFQYRGYKNKKSKLPKDSFTKLIPGLNVDFARTKFLDRKQIFFIYSCKNRKYFRDAIRSVLSDPAQKLVFGTFRDGHGATRPTAVMIMSVIRRASESDYVISDLNATGDCNECFTSY